MNRLNTKPKKGKQMKNIILMLLLLSTSIFASSEAIFKLNLENHIGAITDIITAKNGDILTASNDKTIRVWNPKTGKVKREILGQIEERVYGEIHKIILCDEDKYLAVNSQAYYIENDKKVAGIRIYNYKTGKMFKILKTIQSGITSLMASQDDKYLIALHQNGRVNIYNIKNKFQLTDSFLLADTTISIQMIKKANRYFIVSTSNNELILYDIANKSITKKIKFDRINEGLSEMNLIVNNTFRHIAVCESAPFGYDSNIYIYDYDFNLLKIFSNIDSISSLRSGILYSPNRKLMIVGNTKPSKNTFSIYKTKNYQLDRTLTDNDNTPKSIMTFLTNNKFITIAKKKVTIHNVSNLKQKVVIDNMSQIESIGINNSSLAFGYITHDYEVNKHTKLKYKLNLSNFKFDTIGKEKFSTVTVDNNKYEIFNKNMIRLEIKKNNIRVSEVHLNVKELPFSWSLHKNYIIVGTTKTLGIYNLNGFKIYDLIGHAGTIKSLAVKNNRLVSVDDNNIIKIWDLSTVENIPYPIDEEYLSIIMNASKWSREKTILEHNLIEEKTGRSIYLKPITESLLSSIVKGADLSRSKAKEFLLTNAMKVRGLYEPTQVLKPILNLYISKNNEYIAYTKEGFFTASKNGAKYIGYHINQGADKEARYLSVDKFYDSFYRPDLIQKALNGEDLSKYAKEVNIDSLISSGLAPEVKIVTNSKTSKKRDINLNLEVCTIDDGGYDNITLYLNGMAVEVMGRDRALKLKKQSRIRKECFNISKLISLTNGKNTIGFKATNRAGNIESNLDEITVNYRGRSNKKPNLYVLAIGIDKYRDGDLWLNYSKADAKEFTKSIQKASKPLFKNIYTYELLDKDATKSNILDMFTKIGAKTRREDVFMLYMAGHGITDAKTGAYFYLPVDFRYKNDESVRESGLSQNDFKLGLSKIQAMKSLTILDTCNSGSFAEAMASRGILQKTAINKLTRATGRATIVASSKDQVALEGYKGHGVFTYTLMEALNGKGYGTDNKITIKELAGYIEDVLPDRTYEKWGYEQVPQSHITGNDFPIGVK